MRTAQLIYQMINTFEPGKVFGYDNLKLQSDQFVAAAKALQRLKNKGVIKSISKGQFFKPVKSVFGELNPSEDEILKLYMMKNNKRVSYITGVSLFNSMMLTTQIPNIIRIASYDKRKSCDTGTLKIKTAKSYVKVTDYNYKLLQLLDVLKDFNKIPDLDRRSAVDIIISRFITLSKKAIKEIVEYSFKYPPRVRAFLGSILEYLGDVNEIEKLKESINPFSTFKISLNKNILPTIINWNIK
ncbi:MAG: DUF6088 family protein [Candidatus Delongbacteria bacterium]|jgi:hypothetical protein|nr:DUF6088 family protein [Candidatus Delongbacteria bacterium]